MTRSLDQTAADTAIECARDCLADILDLYALRVSGQDLVEDSIIRESCYSIDWRSNEPGSQDREWRKPIYRPWRFGVYTILLAGGGPEVILTARRIKTRAQRHRLRFSPRYQWEHEHNLPWFDEVDLQGRHWGTPWISVVRQGGSRLVHEQAGSTESVLTALRWYAGRAITLPER